MPRYEPRDKVAETPSETTAIVASAISVQRSGRALRRREAHWQTECWRYYDECGELRYATSWFANALSRAHLTISRRKGPRDFETVPSGPAVDALQELMDGAGGEAALLKSMAQQYFVPGEWYLVGRAPTAEEKKAGLSTDVWEIVSTAEMKVEGDQWYIQYEGADRIDLTDADSVIRMWLPHPKQKKSADSPTRGVRTVLGQISVLNRHINAQVFSRLAGAGLLIVPSEMTFATSQQTEYEPGVDPFLQSLAENMAAAIADPGDPAALVPVMLKASGEHLDKIKHLTFWSELDQQAVPQLDAAIKRLALGLEMPPEVLTGVADVNHWGAWQVDESAIKAHIEPALGVICAAITVGYLRSVLKQGADDLFVTFDTSELRLRPNRSKEALELHDRGEINGRALRRETGFNEDDSLKDEELVAWLLKKVASGSATPEMVSQALNALGVTQVQANDAATMREARPDPSLQDHPEQGPPERKPPSEDMPEAAALFAMCDVLVYRALERAGNRLNNKTKSRPPNIDPTETHLYLQAKPGELDDLLKDVWAPLPTLMAHSPFHPELIEQCLDSYCRTLLSEQRAHTRKDMLHFITAGMEMS